MHVELPKVEDHKPAFFLGAQDLDDTSSEEDFRKENEAPRSHKETQTDQDIAMNDQKVANIQTPHFHYEPKLSDKAPRPIDECLSIMNSDVSACFCNIT